MISWFKKIFGIKPKFFRQGDVLLRKVTSIPKTAIPISSSVIAQGERPGHFHKLKGSQQVFETLDRQLYFEAKQDVILQHPEHNDLEVLAGSYIVLGQRRYNPFEDVQEKVVD